MAWYLGTGTTLTLKLLTLFRFYTLYRLSCTMLLSICIKGYGGTSAASGRSPIAN